MAEVLVEYSDVVISAGTSRYTARACGTAVESGQWQGWLEFIDLDTGECGPLAARNDAAEQN